MLCYEFFVYLVLLKMSIRHNKVYLYSINKLCSLYSLKLAKRCNLHKI